MVPVPRRPGRAFGAAVVALVLVFVGVQWVRSVEPLGLDQGLFACFARWVPRGWLPYRDLFDSKPPLFLYSWVLSALVPGDLVQSVWRLEAAWLTASVALAYAIGKRVWDRPTGLAAATLLFIGLWTPGWGGYWSRAQAEELLTLPLLGAALCALRAIDRERLALFAGVLTGVAGLFKIPSMAVAAAWPLFWWMAGTPRAALRRTLWLFAGVLLPWALAIGWFAAHHALGDFYRGVFLYQRHFAALIAPPWSQVVAGFARQMLTHAGLLLLLSSIGVGVLIKRRAREAWWLLPWIVLTMAAVVLQRQLAEYHFILTVPGLAIAAGYGLVITVRAAAGGQGAMRKLAFAALLGIAALAVHSATMWWDAYHIDALHLAGRLDRDSYLQRLQPGGFSSATEEQTARYLREHSSPGDGILIWGLAPGIHALADRHPVTRYPFHKILMTSAPLSQMIPGLEERRSELVRKLASDPPRYVLLGRGDRNGFEPQDSVASMMQFLPLRDLLRDHYHPETEIGRFMVLRKN